MSIDMLDNGRFLFEKLKRLEELHLTDGNINVDVKLKYYAGAYGLGIKFASDKKYKKSFWILSKANIIEYLNQFEERV